MQITQLGAGAWGFALATLLASKGHHVNCWTIDQELANELNLGKEHPKLPGHRLLPQMRITTNLEEALIGAELIVESVTSAGLRPVCEQLEAIGISNGCPFVITSKGIEQNSGLIMPDVASKTLGSREQIALLSGPSFAKEVAKGLPTAVVCAAYNEETMVRVANAFTTERFRVYLNTDIRGVAFGGALKNVIAIACGIAEGLGLGYSARAALMTRGLHEICKLAMAQNCLQTTLYGLSGMGDLCLTCNAMDSRNFLFGYLLAKGKTPEKAKEEVAMAVEGSYTCRSAIQLCQSLNISMPISEVVHRILYEELPPLEAIGELMERGIKEEHL